MFIRQNILDFSDVSQVLARLMKYPPVESIMVIVDKALIIAGGTAGGTCNMEPTMAYGHMPRRVDKPALPTPLPTAPKQPTPPLNTGYAPAYTAHNAASPATTVQDDDPLSTIAENSSAFAETAGHSLSARPELTHYIGCS